jgi:hypothetical protein
MTKREGKKLLGTYKMCFKAVNKFFDPCVWTNNQGRPMIVKFPRTRGLKSIAKKIDEVKQRLK